SLRAYLAVLALALAIGALHAEVSAASTGPQKVAVVLASFSDSPPEPNTAEEIRRMFFTETQSVNAYYREVSYGQISLTGKLRSDGDVLGWYKINSASAPACDRTAAGQAAAHAVEEAGGSLAGYDHIIYVLNWATECGGVASSAKLQTPTI